MPNLTTNYNLKKPIAATEFYNIEDQNDNMDIIDVELKENSDGISTHVADTDNPHAVTKLQVGLGNVDNTSDANKPVSTAQQMALNLKLDSANPAAIAGNVYSYKNIGGSL